MLYAISREVGLMMVAILDMRLFEMMQLQYMNPYRKDVFDDLQYIEYKAVKND